MFKAIVLLSRKDGTSREAFAQWWLEEHAPLARQLPGLQRAVFNLVREEGEFDGVSELWFESRKAFEYAYASETGKQVAADSMSNVSKRERLLVEEIQVL